MGEPKRGNGNFEMFNHPHTVRRCKRRIRKKDKNALRKYYGITEWETWQEWETYYVKPYKRNEK